MQVGQRRMGRSLSKIHHSNLRQTRRYPCLTVSNTPGPKLGGNSRRKFSKCPYSMMLSNFQKNQSRNRARPPMTQCLRMTKDKGEKQWTTEDCWTQAFPPPPVCESMVYNHSSVSFLFCLLVALSGTIAQIISVVHHRGAQNSLAS